MTRINKTYYSCQSCGYRSPRWLGKCPDCGQWNSLVEEVQRHPIKNIRYQNSRPSSPQPITNIRSEENERIKIKIDELDRVLGGGVVNGSMVLIGGDPGIGKSTLLLQVVDRLANQGLTALYISGEESIQQTKMRADRLGISSKYLYILSETCIEKMLEEIHKLKPKILVIDSIQTVYTSELESAPGSISQVRECASKFIFLAKNYGISTFIIGHVTKEGAIAGPRVLEHLVDTVLYFEGDRGHPYRILRAVKNRFGSTNEIGVFTMKDTGLEEVTNPSELFLSERPIGVSGSVVVPSLEGTRPILVEIQALVTPANFGYPRRTTIGVDSNKVSVLVAVLEKKVGLGILNQDIFVNVAGGVRIFEPAVDLGISASITSGFLDKPIDSKTVVFGEVGLAGEVRAIAQVEVRINEAEKIGFERVIMPATNLNRLRLKTGLKLLGVNSLKETLEILF